MSCGLFGALSCCKRQNDASQPREEGKKLCSIEFISWTIKDLLLIELVNFGLQVNLFSVYPPFYKFLDLATQTLFCLMLPPT